jgi:heme/copper-type cytochrome/quinol oxidase subunit 1
MVQAAYSRADSDFMELWLVVAGAGVGFVLGSFAAVPIGTTAWVAYMALVQNQHSNGPQLEGDLGLWVVAAEIALAAGGIASGVAARRAMRRRRIRD